MVSTSSVTFSSGFDVLGSSFVVGLGVFGGSKYFRGKIDDIYIYDRYLSATDVADLFTAENPTASIQENNSIFSIYPNPTRDNITLQFKEASNFKIYSIEGKLIDSINQIQSNHIVDCSSYPAGVYFIQAGNETLKFVKQD
jgi:hypothetical protein